MAELEKVMPEHLRNPQLPEELMQMPSVDLSKCPAYGGNIAKQQDWTRNQEAKVIIKYAADKAAYFAKLDAEKTKFIESAALNPRTAHVKMAGIRNTLLDETFVFIWESDPEIVEMFESFKTAVIYCFSSESMMLFDVFASLAHNRNEPFPDNRILGYFIKQFDLPFLHQRAWITGVPQRPLFRRGRYWTEEVIDLYEEWGMGERYVPTGGLAGLATMLGSPLAKNGSGFAFGELYAKDPVEGCLYCANDLAVTEDCARRMGIL